MSDGMNDGLAVAVVATCAFQLLSLWQNTAPSLSDIRTAPPRGPVDDDGLTEWDRLRQKLVDAELMIAVVVGVCGFAIWKMSGNLIPLYMMLGILSIVAFWYHQVLAAESR